MFCLGIRIGLSSYKEEDQSILYAEHTTFGVWEVLFQSDLKRVFMMPSL